MKQSCKDGRDRTLPGQAGNINSTGIGNACKTPHSSGRNSGLDQTNSQMQAGLGRAMPSEAGDLSQVSAGQVIKINLDPL